MRLFKILIFLIFGAQLAPTSVLANARVYKSVPAKNQDINSNQAGRLLVEPGAQTESEATIQSDETSDVVNTSEKCVRQLVETYLKEGSRYQNFKVLEPRDETACRPEQIGFKTKDGVIFDRYNLCKVSIQALNPVTGAYDVLDGEIRAYVYNTAPAADEQSIDPVVDPQTPAGGMSGFVCEPAPGLNLEGKLILNLKQKLADKSLKMYGNFLPSSEVTTFEIRKNGKPIMGTYNYRLPIIEDKSKAHFAE